MEVQLLSFLTSALSFLTSALDRNFISFTSRSFYPRGKHHQYSFNGRMGGHPKPVWTIWKRKISCRFRESNYRPQLTLLSHLITHTLSAALFNPLNTELNPICYLLALLGAHHFLHVSRIRVKSLTLRQLMSYIYIYIYDISSLRVNTSALRVNTSAHCSGRKQVKG